VRSICPVLRVSERARSESCFIGAIPRQALALSAAISMRALLGSTVAGRGSFALGQGSWVACIVPLVSAAVSVR
jgi:hypothetical protein